MSRFDEIKARCDAATPGPWHAEQSNAEGPFSEWEIWMPEVGHDGALVEREDDAEFIAAAREDVPWLLERIGELNGAICWDTTCLNCASLLDSNYDQYVRAEIAERKLALIQAIVKDLPPCGKYGEGEDGVSCGWKGAVAGVRFVLADEHDAAVERLERVIDQWRKTGRAVISEMNRADKAEAERDALAAQVAEAVHLTDVWASDLATDAMVNVMDGAVLEAINEQLKRLLELRDALAGSDADTSDTQTTNQEV